MHPTHRQRRLQPARAAAGGVGGSIENKQDRTVSWNADVDIFSGRARRWRSAQRRDPKAINASVRTSGLEPDPGEIVARANLRQRHREQRPRQAFFDDRVDTGAMPVPPRCRSAAADLGFSDTFRQVLITNRWTTTPLKINNIDVINSTVNPLVDLKGPNVR
jgi:hypothetical protein